MHEQDVRRASGRPGGLDSRAAQHTTDYLLESLGMVLAKRAAAPPGSTLVAEVEGSAPAAFGVDDDGVGRRLSEPPADPTVLLALGREAFVKLAGGRRSAGDVSVRVTGDEDLATRILATMAVTP